MRSILIVAASLLLAIAVVQKDLIAQGTTGGEARSEEAIRAVIAKYAEAWNANDMAAWGELFTEDVDYVHRGGGWWKTNEENVEGHRRIHERLAEQNQEMNLELTVASVAFLSPEITLVHVTSEWPGFDAPEGERRPQWNHDDGHGTEGWSLADQGFAEHTGFASRSMITQDIIRPLKERAMKAHKDQTVVVAGGTGNVGGFVVRALLQQGATVAVPSRSERKTRELRAYLGQHVEATGLSRLHTFVGTVSDEVEGREVVQEIRREIGTPGAVIALMGSWPSADSLLEANEEDLDHVLEHYLKAHLGVARTFLPIIKERGGTYVFVNGPLAFEVWPRAGLVSIATAAQHMLFQVLAKEHEDSPVRVAELVTYAYIRNRQTQPGSPLPGEAVGAYAAHLVSELSMEVHGQSIHLRSLKLLKDAGLDITSYEAQVPN